MACYLAILITTTNGKKSEGNLSFITWCSSDILST